ncbi:MAG: type II secretion system secretin GspD [Myxococcaceae bacterium]
MALNRMLSLAVVCSSCFTAALAQPDGDLRAIGPAEKLKPACDELRKKARFNIFFDKVELEKLVQTVADATCKTFILGENVKGKISIIGPENGHVDVTGEQLYAAFLASLDANNLAVYENGRFLKIVEKQKAKQGPIPIPLDPDEVYPLNEQMVTRLFKVKNAELEAVRAVLQQLVSPGGDTIPFPPDTLIVNDLGSNLHRLEKILARLDTRGPADEVQVLQVQFASAQDIADKVTKLFESRGAKPGKTDGLTQLIADDRTNKLIAIASPAALERIGTLMREIDVPIAGEGRINVAYLQHANAEDVASTLQGLAQGSSSSRPKTPSVPAAAAAAKGPSQQAELFQGEVKISADKATNALVVVASRNDFRSLQQVLEKLDVARRQVFVDAVIMEVNLDRTSELGVNLHGGTALSSDKGAIPVVFGTKYSTAQGLPPSTSLANLANYGGFLAGLQGPAIPALKKLGIAIPSFGVLLDAMQTSSDVNVLSTPHLLTTDNEEAEITVGQNVPFQSGFSSSSLSGLSGLLSGTGSTSSLSSLTGLAGSTVPYGQIQRTNVDLKLNIKPQINDSDYVRLAVQVQNEEIASQDQVLGPTTSKRQAKTTVVAKDQETVVIGGIMQERTIEGTSKVPLLGDIPILGHLFRKDNSHKIKVNLLIFLTPYIIRDASDFRRIFERKLKERQQFVEQFYGAKTGYDVAIDFDRKAGPLGKLSQIVNAELRKVENGGPGEPNEKTIDPH